MAMTLRIAKLRNSINSIYGRFYDDTDNKPICLQDSGLAFQVHIIIF